MDDDLMNKETANYLWANTGNQEVARTCLKHIIDHSDNTFDISPTPCSIKEYHDKLLTVHSTNSNILRANAARDLRDNMAKGGKNLYRFIKRDYRGNCSAVFDPDTKLPTTYLPRIHELFHTTWNKILNTHINNKPQWDIFEKAYSASFPVKGGAPSEPPTDKELFQQAQRATPDTNGGMDGWKPYELKLLPLIAWTKRRSLLCLSRRVHKSPTPYYTLPSPALPKGDKFKAPTAEQSQIGDVSKFRLLSLFVSLYRTESGATYRQHQV
jgi:hypothetical protein